MRGFTQCLCCEGFYEDHQIAVHYWSIYLCLCVFCVPLKKQENNE